MHVTHSNKHLVLFDNVPHITGTDVSFLRKMTVRIRNWLIVFPTGGLVRFLSKCFPAISKMQMLRLYLVSSW